MQKAKMGQMLYKGHRLHSSYNGVTIQVPLDTSQDLNNLYQGSGLS